MYRALYEYKSSLPDYFSFCAGDQFTIIDQANKDWFRAQNGRGQIGFVPCTYVKQVQAKAEDVLKFVDWSIEAIHLQATNEGAGQYTKHQRLTLQKMVKHRADLVEQLSSKLSLERSHSEDIARQQSKPERDTATHRHSEKRRAPPPPASEGERAPQQTAEQMPATLAQSSVTGNNHIQVRQHPNSSLPVSPTSTASSSSPIVSEPDFASPTVYSQHLQISPDSDLPPPPPSDQPLNHSCLPSSQHFTPRTKSASHPAECNSTEPASAGPVEIPELLNRLEVPEKIGPQLLEEVRRNTGLSFEKSKIAVETVLGYVGFKMPALEGLMDKVLSSLHFGRDISDEDITSHDAERLGVIFSELTACKDDSQQRSWALHEDEAIIQEYLQELLSILENAKPSICRKVVSRDSYEILHNLVQYYQMETRGTLCRLLLKVFGALCGLEKEVVTNLLYSVLPLELAQELTAHNEDVQRVSYVALVMTMIFSTGQNVSTAVSDKLNADFFVHILQLVEEPPSSQFEDTAVDLLISFILAFNLHLISVDTNVVLRALSTCGNPKVFTERIMVWINRGEDPVKMFEFKPSPPNSVIKLFLDLYSDLTTSDLLYTNDAKVLIDVIVGRLSNLSPGDEIRSKFLVLCQRVVQNSTYSEHCHRVGDLQTCLQNICSEEADTPEDKRFALDILCNNRDIFLD